MTAPETIRVLVADDHALVREGIRRVLEASPGFEVIAEAGNGPEVLAMVAARRPDVVVLDISMPGESGLQVAERLRIQFPDCRVLMLSVHDHPEYVLQSVRAGACGYLRKDAAPAELRSAIRAVHAGGEFFPPPVARQLSAALRGESAQAARTDRLEQLTAREREVLALVARGHTNKQIAAALVLSPRTVESYRESLMRKLEIRTVAGLTKFALQVGLATESSGE